MIEKRNKSTRTGNLQQQIYIFSEPDVILCYDKLYRDSHYLISETF